MNDTRSQVTIDLAALRHNVGRLRSAAGSAALYAVVKADGYGHGAVDVGLAALAGGAEALCVATVAEGALLRRSIREARIIVMGPFTASEGIVARDRQLEVAVSALPLPEGLRCHVKVDTGMGRWGMPPSEAAEVPADDVVGVMSHLATADEPDRSFARRQIERFAEVAARFPGAVRHIANSAATLRLPEATFDAARCGLAIYGLSPFHDDPASHGLRPVLSWRSTVVYERRLRAGESTGYGRRFRASAETRIGLVPVGYADGWARGLGDAEVLVDGVRAPIAGAISMDSFAVVLPPATGAGSTVSLIGDGLLAEEHAARSGTITYELVCRIRTDESRARRRTVDHG